MKKDRLWLYITFAVALGIGFVGEEIGMRTGLVFGPYYHISISQCVTGSTGIRQSNKAL